MSDIPALPDTLASFSILIDWRYGSKTSALCSKNGGDGDEGCGIVPVIIFVEDVYSIKLED